MARVNIAVIGLGRMGQALVKRLSRGDFNVYGYDARSESLPSMPAMITPTLEDAVQAVDIVWLMVPAGQPVDDLLGQIVAMKKQCVVVDGGNSNYKDTVRRYHELAQVGIPFVDCGTSGGLKGEEIGYSLMIGGDVAVYEQLRPIFAAIAMDGGYAYMGPAGAGHYVKMVHNGIEYALLQAYAEGFHLLREGSYKDLDLERIADVWGHGSVIRSWIVDLCKDIFQEDQRLHHVSGAIGENKTGQWTLEEAREVGVPVDLIERSLMIRSWSRDSGGNFATKLVALLRKKFGGHPLQEKKDRQ